MIRLPVTISEQLSNQLAMAMDEKEISQPDLAKKAYVSLSQVNNMVNGRNSQSLAMWQRVLDVVGAQVRVEVTLKGD